MFASRLSLRTRTTTTALLMGLSLAAACGDTPTGATGGNGGGTPRPTEPTKHATVEIVQVAPDTLTVLAVGGHRRVEATARTADGAVLEGRTPSWSSSDVRIAYVDASGNVSGLQPGRAWITATIDGKTGRARVDVLPLTVDSIALASPTLTLQFGTARYLGATLRAADGRTLYDRPITWTISDPGVATVDASGLVTGHRGGRTWLTATSEGRTARAEVIVPDVKVMTLAAVAGAGLPIQVMDSVYDDGQGVRRRVWSVALEGTLRLDSRTGTYEQVVTLRTSTSRVTCTDWGSCIGDPARIETREVHDRGRMERDPHTGLPIFYSATAAGGVYYAESAPQDGYTIRQVLPGTDQRLAWGYRL